MRLRARGLLACVLFVVSSACHDEGGRDAGAQRDPTADVRDASRARSLPFHRGARRRDGDADSARIHREILLDLGHPCHDAGASADEAFGCASDGDCAMSELGAVGRPFRDTRRSHKQTTDLTDCANHGDRDAICQAGACVVPSDIACSPALFGDAGLLDNEQLAPYLPLPDAPPPLEDVLFVIPAARARVNGFPRGDRYWTPSFELVKHVALDKVPAALARSCDPRARLVHDRLAAYRAQFVGVILGGRAWLYGNFVCRRDGDGEDQSADLATTWRTVDDGGICIVDFRYYPSDDTMHDFAIHGPG